MTTGWIGLDDYRKALEDVPKKLRRRALLAALTAAAKPVQHEIQINTPILREGTRAPYRRPGTVRGAIAIRVSRAAVRRGDVGVFVNVKPAPAGMQGAKNPSDPYYWRWLFFEHKSRGGTTVRGTHSLETGAKRFADAVREFERVLGPAIQALNDNPKAKL